MADDSAAVTALVAPAPAPTSGGGRTFEAAIKAECVPAYAHIHPSVFTLHLSKTPNSLLCHKRYRVPSFLPINTAAPAPAPAPAPAEAPAEGSGGGWEAEAEEGGDGGGGAGYGKKRKQKGCVDLGCWHVVGEMMGC